MEVFALIVWSILLILSIILEAITTSLVSIWFIPGILIAMALTAFNVPIVIQIIVFVVVSLICLIATKPLVTKIKAKMKNGKTNLDTLIGNQYIVIEPSPDKFTCGLIRVGDIEWKILPIDNEILEVNDIVVVSEIKGNTMYVRKYKPHNMEQKEQKERKEDK